MLFEWTRRYLLAVGIFVPITFILITTLITHVITLYLLTFVWKLGILGIGVSTSVTYVLNLVTITIYSFITKHEAAKNSRRWISLNAFKKIPEFLRYGFPSSWTNFIDWVSFEILTIYWGWLGVDELAASVVMTNILYILQESSLGISYTSSSLVGNPLGEKKPKNAKRYAWVTVLWSAFWSGATTLVYITSHNHILRFYTAEQNVINIANSAFIIFFITWFCDMMQNAMGGVIRAIGFQNFSAIFNFIVWWCLPFSFL